VVLNAPPGSYILIVRVPGYKVYSENVTLQGTEMSRQVMLVRMGPNYPAK